MSPAPDLPEKLDLGTVLVIVRDEFREHENLRHPTARALERAATDAYYELAARHDSPHPTRPQPVDLSVGELNALPAGTAILDGLGAAAVKNSDGNWNYGSCVLNPLLVTANGPCQILHKPTPRKSKKATE